MKQRYKLAEVTERLVAVAMGRSQLVVIKGGRLVNVNTGEIQPDMDVAITHGRIAYVGPDASHTIGADTQIIDAAGRYIAPGFMDGHIHIESSMLTVREYTKA